MGGWSGRGGPGESRGLDATSFPTPAKAADGDRDMWIWRGRGGICEPPLHTGAGGGGVREKW